MTFYRSLYNVHFSQANQDVHALAQKSSSIFPITHFILKLETSTFNF